MHLWALRIQTGNRFIRRGHWRLDKKNQVSGRGLTCEAKTRKYSKEDVKNNNMEKKERKKEKSSASQNTSQKTLDGQMFKGLEMCQWCMWLWEVQFLKLYFDTFKSELKKHRLSFQSPPREGTKDREEMHCLGRGCPLYWKPCRILRSVSFN